MGVLTRTITAKGSSASGYWTRNSEKTFSVDVSDTGAFAGANVTEARLTLSNIKSYSSGNTYFEVWINGSLAGRATTALQSNSSLHSVSFNLESLSDVLINGEITSFEVKAASNANGNKAYYYRSNESSATVATITASTTFSDPSAPDTVLLNGAAGNIYVKDGVGVTLSWSGAQAGTRNQIVGYEVLKNGSVFASLGADAWQIAVDAPAVGSNITYAVRAIGQYSNSANSVARIVYGYSDPTPPTSIKVNGASSVIVDAGTIVNVTWSGAQAGANNGIYGYQFYVSYQPDSGYLAYGSVITGTSATLQASSTMGEKLYFKLATVGYVSQGSMSDATIVLETKVYTANNAPDTVNASPSVTSAGNLVTLSWSGAQAGTNVNIASYAVYRSENRDSGFELLATTTGTSMNVYAPPETGHAYYYRVAALADRAGYDSGLSLAYAILAVPDAPQAPIIQGTTNGKSYNPRPRVLAQIPSNTIEGLGQTISAIGWTASRTGQVAGEKVVLRKDTAYNASGTSTVEFSNRDSYEGVSTVNVDVKYQSAEWTDDPIEAGYTTIKAAHMNELRRAIDDIRAWYGMGAYQWQDEIIAGVTSSVRWVSHALEIKAQIEAIRDFVNAWDSTNSVFDISLPNISAFYAPKADVINALRQAITLL